MKKVHIDGHDGTTLCNMQLNPGILTSGETTCLKCISVKLHANGKPRVMEASVGEDTMHDPEGSRRMWMLNLPHDNGADAKALVTYARNYKAAIPLQTSANSKAVAKLTRKIESVRGEPGDVIRKIMGREWPGNGRAR